MFDSLDLAGRLLEAFPPQRYLQLLPWHLTAILIGLSVLASFGLHHLIGDTFRFYSAGGRRRPILAACTLAVLLGSMLALLLAYGLRTQAEALIRPALAPENAVPPASVLGSILLDPPFKDAALGQETHIAKARLSAVIGAKHDEDYRDALKPFAVKPDKFVLAAPPIATAPSALAPSLSQAPPQAAGAPPAPVFTRPEDLISGIVAQIGLRWMLDAKQTWPEAMPAGAGSSADRPLSLPELTLALIDEIQDGAVLDRLDWEHVAGTRFVQVVLHPVLLELIGRWAALLAVLVLAADLAYFAMATRIVRRLRRSARSTTAG
jgi:hypothetical protein